MGKDTLIVYHIASSNVYSLVLILQLQISNGLGLRIGASSHYEQDHHLRQVLLGSHVHELVEVVAQVSPENALHQFGYEGDVEFEDIRKRGEVVFVDLESLVSEMGQSSLRMQFLRLLQKSLVFALVLGKLRKKRSLQLHCLFAPILEGVDAEEEEFVEWFGSLALNQVEHFFELLLRVLLGGQILLHLGD